MEVSGYLDDERQTVAFGEAVAAAAAAVLTESSQRQGLVVFLLGDLGAGKTTFCRGVLKGFGHNGAVKSPTYTLVEPYELSSVIYHFDLYRLGDPEELEYMGIRDYFDAGSLCLIEWPSKGRGFLPQEDLQLQINAQEPGRSYQLQAFSEAGQKVIQCLKAQGCLI